MTTSILVTGGTGQLGRLVVPLLRDAGRSVRVLSRHGSGADHVTADLLKGEGIEAALDGIETVLHLAGGPKGDDEATRNLMRAAVGAGVQHVVFISVAAADRLPLGYYRAKTAAEVIVSESGVPWTTLRAAQFHDFAFTGVRALAKSPIVPVPSGIRLQPVETSEVAARLVELALGEPAGFVPDLVGPKIYTFGELLDGYLRASGKRRLTVPVRLPGAVGRAYRAGHNLVLDGAAVGTRTWEEFLAERVPPTRP
ncbi:uncharacterized protein YbjT (DUF2867 family) [Allocatelliglobosispora scoriae]|uniref:Uncharacterized protein YbjT (DUF2867 family) n=1 Tax=Allocatelliglobosispora scoriae TaxID=643052 RepID=A0A841BRW8_9ACTN|nr:NAD(P)H-binding protein [Allocatelliglobosispora scoriae]MBB5870148.1 uncharacterized protein YbjT (DUF2867 family) [Allocatelliglobosispora scoriae]